MNIYALKAPARNFTLPAWVAVHNAKLAGAALVIILLAFAVLRLSKGGGKPAPAPAPAPKKSGGGGGRLLLLAGLGGAGFWYWDTHLRHAPAAAAAPAPAPSPTPVPTVTQTVAPPAAHSGSQPGLLANLTAWMNHLTGTDWVLIVLIGAVATFVIVRPLLRRGD